MTERPAPIDARHCALFLDVDGTLLAIESSPDQVVADASLRHLLSGLSRALGGALALISGRTIAAIDRIFAPLKLPAAGAHGTELRVNGDDARDDTSHALPAHAIAALREFAGAHEGLLLEPKPGGASLHYRRAPELEDTCRRRLQLLLDGLGAGYRLIEGKMVLELVPSGASKGRAIHALMQEAPFAGRRPVFIGDDTTDEDGFRVVNALGGTSIRVGGRDGSVALHTLADVDAVRQWLAAAVGPGNAGTGDARLAQP
jgi:trehalose 6-phosphate phosphatase